MKDVTTALSWINKVLVTEDGQLVKIARERISICNLTSEEAIADQELQKKLKAPPKLTIHKFPFEKGQSVIVAIFSDYVNDGHPGE